MNSKARDVGRDMAPSPHLHTDMLGYTSHSYRGNILNMFLKDY